MRKSLLLFIYIFFFLLITNASITDWSSHVSIDNSDSDNNYSPGQIISIKVTTDFDYPTGEVQIFSNSVSENSGKQNLTQIGSDSTNYYYKFDWDTTGFSQADDYSVTYYFEDDVQTPYQIKLDSSAPNCSSFSLQNSEGNTNIVRNGDQITIRATITDSSFLGASNINQGNIKANLIPLNLGSDVVCDSYDTNSKIAIWTNKTVTGLTGNVTIDINATEDRASNSVTGVTTLDITYDGTNPVCTNIKTLNDAGVENFIKQNSTFKIVAAINEPNMQKEDILLDGTSLGLGSSIPASEYDNSYATWEVTVGTISEGMKTINITGKDDAGNNITGITSHNINIDNTAPVINSILITNSTGTSQYIKDGETVNVKVDVSDININKDLIYADLTDFGQGSSVNPDSYNAGILEWNFTANLTVDGVCNFNLLSTSIDKSTNLITGTLTKDIMGDISAPEVSSIELVNSFTNSNIARAGDTVDIIVNITDNNALLSSQIYLDLTELGGSRDVNVTSYSSGQGIYQGYVIPESVTEGTYLVKVTTTTEDSAGNIAIAAAGGDTGETVIIDNTAPDILSLSIYGTEKNNGYSKATDTIKVVADISGENNIDSSQIFLDASSIGLSTTIAPTQYTNSEGATWEVSLTDFSPSGTYELIVTGHDMAGNDISGITSETLEVDITAPICDSISIQNPSGFSTTYKNGDSITVRAQISDPENNLEASAITADLSDFISGSTSVTPDSYDGVEALWNISVSNPALEGNKTFTISNTVKDISGNILTGTLTSTIEEDNTAPVISYDQLDGSHVKDGTVEITLSIAETGAIKNRNINLNYKIDSGTAQLITMETESSSTPYVYKAKIPEVSGNNILYWITGQDDAGNSLSSAATPNGLSEVNGITLNVDSQAPSFDTSGTSVLEDNTEGDFFVKDGDKIKVSINASDDVSASSNILVSADLSSIHDTFSNNQNIPYVSGDNFEFITDIIPELDLIDGTKEVIVKLEDEVGNISTKELEIFVDKTEPLTLDKSFISNNGDIYFKEGDTGEIYLDMGERFLKCTAEISSLDSSFTNTIMIDNDDNTYSLEIPQLTAAMNEGTISVNINIEDRSGNTSLETVKVFLDRTAVNFASGTIEITDVDNWYKENDAINLRLTMPPEEKDLEVWVDLSPLGGNFADRTHEVFLPVVVGEYAVYDFTSIPLDSSITELNDQALVITAKDQSGNEQTDNSILINTDITLPLISQIVYFKDGFENQKISNENTYPVIIDDIYYNTLNPAQSNILKSTFEVIITDSNIEPDLSQFKLMWGITGSTDEISIKDMVDNGSAEINISADDYTVTFKAVEFEVPGMNSEDIFDIYIKGMDSSENFINEKIITTTLKDYDVISDTVQTNVNPANIAPTGYSKITFNADDIDLYGYNTGFDAIKIVLSDQWIRNIRLDNAHIKTGNPLSELTILENTTTSGEAKVSINNMEVLYEFPYDKLYHTGSGTIEVDLEVSLEVEPQLFIASNPALFEMHLLDTTTGKTIQLPGALEVNINSPVTDVVSEIWPPYMVPSQKSNTSIYIKPVVNTEDVGYDRITIKNLLDDGFFEIGDNGTDDWIDNGDSIEITIGSTVYNIAGDGIVDQPDEAGVYHQDGSDTFEIYLSSAHKTDELIKIEYKVQAPSTELLKGSFEVTLKNSSAQLSVTDSVGGDATSDKSNDKLSFYSRDMISSVIAEVNPSKTVQNSDCTLEIMLNFNITGNNSGVNRFKVTIPEFNLLDINDPSSVDVTLSTYNLETVVLAEPSTNQVKMTAVNNGSDLELELISGQRLNVSSINKRVNIKIYGISGNVAGVNDLDVKVGDNTSEYLYTALAGDADFVDNNDSLSIKNGKIYQGFEYLNVFPDKVARNNSSQFKIDINPDFSSALNDLDADIFYIEIPENLFDISDPVSIRNSVSVKTERYNMGTPVIRELSEIYSGTPGINEALVSMTGNTIEVRLGEILHGEISPDTEATLEVTLYAKALDISETSGNINVKVKNSQSRETQLTGIVSGNTIISLKEPFIQASGWIEHPIDGRKENYYVKSGTAANIMNYYTKATVLASGEPVNKINIDFPDILGVADSSWIQSIALQIGAGIMNDISADCTIRDDLDSDIEIYLNTTQISPGQTGTFEIQFNFDIPEQYNYPTGDKINVALDNKDFSLPVWVSDDSTNSTRFYITETCTDLKAEVNPAFMQISTEERINLTLLPQINTGQFGFDSLEIILPEGLNSKDNNFILKVDGINKNEGIYYERSTYEIVSNLPDTREVLTIGLLANNNITDSSLIELLFDVYANNKIYTQQDSFEIKYISNDLEFAPKYAHAMDIDGINNNNSLELVTEGYPAIITGAMFVPDEMIVNTISDCTMNIDFDYINEQNHGIDNVVVDLPTGFTPYDIGNTIVTIDSFPVVCSYNISVNDLIIDLPSSYSIVGSHNMQIDFKIQTPQESQSAQINARLISDNSRFDYSVPQEQIDANCTFDLRKEVKNVSGGILPNNAIAGKNNMFSIFIRPEIEAGDIGINRLLINYPSGYSFNSGSEIDLYKIYDDTVEAIDINPEEHNLFIPEYGSGGKTYDLGISTLTDPLTLKSPTFEVSTTNIYRLDIELTAPALPIDSEYIDGTFELFVDNKHSLKEIQVEKSDSLDNYPDWAGKIFSVRSSQTKIQEGSVQVNLTGSVNGMYKIEMSCKFTAVMNTTITPKISVKSGSKAIELQSVLYEHNRYSGVGYIPVADINSFTDNIDIYFDNNTVKDIYGTSISEELITGFKVNPAFIIADFPVPFSQNSLLILCRASESIKDDILVTLEQSNDIPKIIDMEYLGNNLYRGVANLDLTKTGLAFIKVIGTEYNGLKTGEDRKYFEIFRGGINNSVFKGTNYSVTLNKDSFTEQNGAIVSEFAYNTEEKLKKVARISSENNEKDLDYLQTGIRIHTKDPILKSIKIDTTKEIEKDKAAIFTILQDETTKYYSKLSEGIRKSGSYIIAVDKKGPEIIENHDKLKLKDNETGIERFKIIIGKNTINRTIQREEYDLDLDKELRLNTKEPVEIEIEVYDRVGNSINKTVKYVPTSIGNLKAVTYPNPASDYVTIKADGLSLSSAAYLKIYDTSGKLIYKDKMPALSEYIWDLTDKRGKKVSNGIYFYKIQIDGFETIGKIVVLR